MTRKTTIRTVLALLALAGTSCPLRAATVTVPGPLTIVPLDVTSITTGGTAVTVLAPGEHSSGGYLVTSNAAGACFSENGTAGTATGYSGTTFTTCVAANVFYPLSPSIGPVSANSSASTVALSGYGLKQ